MTDPRSPKKLFKLSSTRASVRHEIDDEMRFHLQTRTDDLMRQGHSRDDAERIAVQEYGDLASARAELTSIDRRRLKKMAFREWLSSWVQDLRFAARGLRARPGFTLTIL